MRPLSVSGLATFAQCPLRWRFIHVDHFREAPQGSGNLGTAVHAGIEAWNRRPTDAPIGVEPLLAAFHEAWDDEGFDTPEAAQAAKTEGERLLREFHARHQDTLRPLSVERRFIMKWDGVTVQGVADAVLPLPGGGVEIVDYKTTRHPITERTVAESDQLTLYQVAAEREWGYRVEKLTLYHVRTQTPVTAPRRSEEQVRALWQRLNTVKEAVEKKRLPPRMGAHCPCEFANRCPYFAPSFQFSLGGEYRQPVGKALGALALLAPGAPERKGLEAEILEFLQRENLPRLYGETHLAERLPDGSLVVRERDDL
ncbi:MAG TPA: PD-(D/E)XK nuclease family protein [Candidatus Thermoplasmatota archaeon]|nr:PD-(D/E)XK nuclease family protein [Candidatus Thermoplasmatota archaeon]